MAMLTRGFASPESHLHISLTLQKMTLPPRLLDIACCTYKGGLGRICERDEFPITFLVYVVIVTDKEKMQEYVSVCNL